MARILVVEDDRSIAELVAIYLRREGHQVEIVLNGADALHLFERSSPSPDLIVLDLMLPGLDGRGVARRIRATSNLPIIMLTALDDDRDKIEGLDLGADDYLTKPFNPDELVARVRAILRRVATPQSESISNASTGQTGNVHIDHDARRVFINSTELLLRTREFELLTTLIEHLNTVLTRDQLLERAWGGDFDGDTRTVDMHISRLRERLTSSGATVVIDTIRSVGYRMSVNLDS